MFIAFMFGMVSQLEYAIFNWDKLCDCFQFFLFFYAWSQGDVTRLTQGYDVSGNICGKDNEPVVLEDGKTVLFRYNLIESFNLRTL